MDTSLAHFLAAVCLPMYVALAVAKEIVYGGWPSWLSLRFHLKCSLTTFQDLLFVLGWAFVGIVLMGGTRYRSTLRRILEWAFLSISALIVIYGFANISVYSALRMPLTYPLLMMAGGVSDIRSSVASYVTFSSVSAMIMAPVAYLLLVYGALRWRRLGQWHVYAILAVLIGIFLPAGVYGNVRWFSGGPDEGVARSPHWALLRSYVEHWSGNATEPMRDEGPASFRDDFLVAGDRPASGNAKHGASPIKNVIVVVLESTGTQFLSVYGSSFRTTPNLEAEARNSLIYNNFYSNDGYTLYTMMPLLLSSYPGSGWTVYASEYPRIAGTTPAQVLHAMGYRTAFMTSQSLDYRNIREFFQNRGFDEVFGAEEFQKLGEGTMLSSWGMDDPPLFDRLMQWIGTDNSKPFYAMIWTQQTHHPYPQDHNQQTVYFGGDLTTPSGQAFNHYLNNLYLADQQLARLFAMLRQRGLEKNTLVVITGDHGESFGFPHRWTFHGTALYQESINVPLILWSPRLFNPGRRSDVVGAHIDLNSTVFDLLGLPPPVSWQGRSLMDADRPQRSYFSCNTGYLLEGMREQNEKFIYNITLAREELYDLANDPGEQRNLAQQEPELCKIYRARLAAWTSFQKRHLDALIGQGAAH